MNAKDNASVALGKSLILPLFMPGHICARVAVSISWWVTILGLVNVFYVAALQYFFNAEMTVGFGASKIAIWAIATSYLIVFPLIHKLLFSKAIEADKLANSEQDSSAASLKAA